MIRARLRAHFGDKEWQSALADIDFKNIQNARGLLAINGIESQPVSVVPIYDGGGDTLMEDDDSWYYLMVREHDFPDALGILRHAIENNKPAHEDTLAHLKELGA